MKRRPVLVRVRGSRKEQSHVASVTLKNIRKVYPGTAKRRRRLINPRVKGFGLQAAAEGVPAVQNFSIEIRDREFVVLVGPSGCGKSTILRMIAGLEEITNGELMIGGRRMNDVLPKDRDVAMVFQNYALYPHMTVYDNMAFPLKLKKMDKTAIDRKVRETAEILDITEYLDRKPKALSGGQMQRVAIGRAIVRRPKVFLMDEPLSNLDAKLRNQMRTEIIKLRRRIDTTFIYVTHDQTEAMTLGDRIVILKDGVIQQIGTPMEVFDYPANLFVAGFIGVPQMNFFGAELVMESGKYAVRLAESSILLPESKQACLSAGKVGPQPIILGVRPEHITPVPEGDFHGVLDFSEMMGSAVHLHIDAMGTEAVIVVQAPELLKAAKNLSGGSDLAFTFSGDAVHIFARDTGRNLTDHAYGRIHGLS